MATEEIKESISELWRLSKVSLWGIVTCFLILLCVEIFVVPEISGVSNGFLMGALSSVLNLHILGRTFAPLVHTGERRALALLGSLTSLGVMAFGVYLVFALVPHLLLGLALGIASPAFFGFLYAAFSTAQSAES